MTDGDLRNYMELAEQRRIEIERLKAERDEKAALVVEAWADVIGPRKARLDKALAALRRELNYTHGADTIDRLCAAIAEIEGDPEWKQQKC